MSSHLSDAGSSAQQPATVGSPAQQPATVGSPAQQPATVGSPAQQPVAGSRPVRVFRNDWGSLNPPPLGSWRPTRSVSVVIPAYNCQKSLDLTLAALAHQTYPSDLLDVIVVDDTSDPPIELPAIRPANCRVVRVAEHGGGWGRSNALHVGATASTGDILHWLDADMVVFPEHVEAQARWQHVCEDAVTLGYKRFVGEGWATAEEVARRSADRTIDTLFRFEETEPHDYVEQLIDSTDRLRRGDHLTFRAHVGATAALTRHLYERSGGLDTELRLGEDTEFGYRLAQAGAVFVPEPLAGSWHMGPSNMMTRGDALRRYNRPFLADRMPHPRHLRSAAHRTWKVPLVTAVVPADGGYELVRTCVDRLLASDQHDLRVKLVGAWSQISDERRSVLSDPLLDRRLLVESYRNEARVDLVEQEPETAFPSPYLVRVPPYAGFAVDTLRHIVEAADHDQVGLLRLRPAGANGEVEPVRLYRTSALSRAVRVRQPGEDLGSVVAEVAGGTWLDGERCGLVDLRGLPADRLISPRPRLVVRSAWSGPRSSEGVESVTVGGVRSLADATGFVARRYAAGAARKVLRRVRNRKVR